MNTLFTRYVVTQLIQEIDTNLPEQVQQLAHQLETKSQLVLYDFGYYGLFLASLLGIISVLFGSLMLLMDYSHSRRKSVLPSQYQSSRKSTYRQSKHILDTHIAKANRAELRFVSAQIRAGKLSN